MYRYFDCNLFLATPSVIPATESLERRVGVAIHPPATAGSAVLKLPIFSLMLTCWLTGRVANARLGGVKRHTASICLIYIYIYIYK